MNGIVYFFQARLYYVFSQPTDSDIKKLEKLSFHTLVTLAE